VWFPSEYIWRRHVSTVRRQQKCSKVEAAASKGPVWGVETAKNTTIWRQGMALWRQ